MYFNIILYIFILPVIWFMIKNMYIKYKPVNFKDMDRVLITGGTSGIGLAVAKRLLVHTNIKRLLVCSRNIEKVKNTVKVLEPLTKRNVMVVGKSLDVTDEKSVEMICKDFDPNLIITCAGINKCDYFRNFSNDDIRRNFEVDCLGALNVIRHSLPSMVRKKKGRIVSIESMLTALPMMGYAGFCAAKGAIQLALQTVQSEYRKHGIFIQHCIPPYIETDMTKNENEIPELTEKFGKIFDRTTDEFAKNIVDGINSKQKIIGYYGSFMFFSAITIKSIAIEYTSFFQFIGNTIMFPAAYIIAFVYRKVMIAYGF